MKELTVYVNKTLQTPYGEIPEGKYYAEEDGNCTVIIDFLSFKAFFVSGAGLTKL